MKIKKAINDLSGGKFKYHDLHPDSLKTYIIAGNHDDSWYKQGVADILKANHKARLDIIPVGRTTARLKGQDVGEIELTHLEFFEDRIKTGWVE